MKGTGLVVAAGLLAVAGSATAANAGACQSASEAVEAFATVNLDSLDSVCALIDQAY